MSNSMPDIKKICESHIKINNNNVGSSATYNNGWLDGNTKAYQSILDFIKKEEEDVKSEN